MITLLAIYTEGNPASLTPQCGCLCHHSLVSSRSERERKTFVCKRSSMQFSDSHFYLTTELQ